MLCAQLPDEENMCEACAMASGLLEYMHPGMFERNPSRMHHRGTRRVCMRLTAEVRNPSRTGMPTLEECPQCFLGCFAGALTYSKRGSSVQCTCPRQWSCCFHKDPKAPACRAVRLMAPVSKITGL